MRPWVASNQNVHGGRKALAGVMCGGILEGCVRHRVVRELNELQVSGEDPVVGLEKGSCSWTGSKTPMRKWGVRLPKQKDGGRVVLSKKRDEINLRNCGAVVVTHATMRR